MYEYTVTSGSAHTPALLAFCGLLISMSAGAETIVTFDVPGATETYPVSINAAGAIAGSYTDSQSQQHGFVRDQNGAITKFDVPGSTTTVPTVINVRGMIAGYYTIGYTEHGFVRDQKGAITAFDVEKSGRTHPTSMNARGVIAGLSDGHGFIRDTDGAITLFDVPVPGASDTQPMSINDAGMIVGSYFEIAHYRLHGFIRDPHGAIRVFDVGSDATNWTWGTGQADRTLPQSIDDAGQITGSFYISDVGRPHGFIRDRQGLTTTFDAIQGALPDAVFTQPVSISAGGKITGSEGFGAPEGFVRDADGAITTFTVPGCEQTRATSINASGVVTGNCLHCVITGNVAYCARHGFQREP